MPRRDGCGTAIAYPNEKMETLATDSDSIVLTGSGFDATNSSLNSILQYPGKHLFRLKSTGL